MAVTSGAIATTMSTTFLAGTVIAGVGFGLACLGSFRTTTALATPGQRAGLVAAIFSVGYLAFSVPALIAGLATTKFGLYPTALVYSASPAAPAAAGILLFRPGDKPTHPAPGLICRHATGTVHRSAVPATGRSRYRTTIRDAVKRF
jgi:hypothetical protein